MATPKVRAATEASMSDLAPHLPRTSKLPDGTSYTLRLTPTSRLGNRLRNALYDLFNTNMSSLSKGTSMAYTATSKQEEMFDPSTRFLLVLRTESDSDIMMMPLPMPGALPMTSTRKGNGKGKERAEKQVEVEVEREEDLLGFLSFRFDTEETLGSRDAEVIYCYEIHLSAHVRGRGLGDVLLDEFEEIGRTRNMDKGMLTCLRDNATALRFYEKHGYVPDEIDPTRMDEEEEWEDVGADADSKSYRSEGVDYRILSKELR